jgi:CheY-like chemotaxis protein
MPDKPRFRVGAAGLDPRDCRLIEIVFRHSSYNRYAFGLMPAPRPDDIDLLIANPQDPAGEAAMHAVRVSARPIPVVEALPAGVPLPAGAALALDRLTLQLLPMLNRLVDQGGLAAAAPATADAPRPTPLPQSGLPAAPAVRSAWSAQPPGARPAAQPAVAAPDVAPASAPAPSNLVSLPLRSLDPPFVQRLRVLVVDDSPTVRRQLTIALDRMGIASETVDCATAALERLAAQHFDLALLDIVMPDMDGYRLTREIRRNRALRQLPVIILTSRSSPFDLARGALAGCDTYLTKPVPFRALEAAVLKQLRRSLAIDDLAGLVRPSVPPAELAAAPPPPGVLSRLFGRP